MMQYNVLHLQIDVHGNFLQTAYMYGSKEEDMGWKGQGIIYILALPRCIVFPFPFQPISSSLLPYCIRDTCKKLKLPKAWFTIGHKDHCDSLRPNFTTILTAVKDAK